MIAAYDHENSTETHCHVDIIYNVYSLIFSELDRTKNILQYDKTCNLIKI